MKKIYLEPNDKILNNPGMGWVMHSSIEKGYKDHNELDSYENINAVAVLSSWAKIEITENEFDFTDLDDAINKWSSLGKEIHIRISTDPMIYLGAFGVPNYLFDKYKVPYQEKVIYNEVAKFPDYLNKDYLDRLSNFLKVLSDRYYLNKKVVQMDLRGYGEWGEWHSGYMHDDINTHVKALRTIIDTWDKAINNKIPLVLSGSYEWRNDLPLKLHAPKSYDEFKYFQGFDYALSKPNITFRRDGIGGAIKYYDYELFQEYFDKYHRLPLTTEFFTAYVKQKNNEDGVRGYFAEDALEEALKMHPNYMMLMWDSNEFYHERFDLIKHGLLRMGYRLYPSIVEIDSSSNHVLKLTTTWSNQGVGRIFNNHEIRFKLIDSFNHEINYVDDIINLHNVTEKKNQTFISLIDYKKLKGDIKLSISLYDLKNEKYLALPLNLVSLNHYYEIATFNKGI